LILVPLSKFGDFASYSLTNNFLNNYEYFQNKTSLKTLLSSFNAALFRILIMPFENIKIAK